MSKYKIDSLPKGGYVHMIGIGGISMSGLAEVLLNFGYKVSGSDAKESSLIEKLRKNGAQVYIGQSADNIKSPDLVCYTAAIHEDNPELKKARSLGVPVIERAELLGAVMEKYKYPIAIAGTHGKTTTTSMMSLVLLAADKDPTIMVGGELKEIGGNYRIGGHEYMPFEACEYVESFLHFNPYISIITNVEEDHLDYFKDLNHIISSFGKFARLTDEKGCIIVYIDEDSTKEIAKNLDRNVITYGLTNTDADYTAKNIVVREDGCSSFDVYNNDRFVVNIELNVAGKHNVLNSLAVTAASEFLGLNLEDVKKGLESFGGTKRRFEKIGKTKSGAQIIDDYAHHPTEIAATLNTAKAMVKGKLWIVFQPHTYTRTKAFLEDFAKALSIADRVMITDVYAAREKYDGTVHACDLATLIPGVVYMNDMEAMVKYLEKNVASDDMVITMGAGDIYKVGYTLAENGISGTEDK